MAGEIYYYGEMMNWKFVLAVIIICTVIVAVIYRRQAKHELSKDAQQRLDLILENMPEEFKFLMKISDKVFARIEKVAFEGLTDAEKVFFYVWTLKGDVDNGGFDQYFFNFSGEYSIEVVHAFEKIGAGKTAGIIRGANSVFENSQPPKDRTARKKELDALPESAQEKLRALDDEFYRCDEDIDKLLYEFVVKHEAEFLNV